MQSEYFSHLDKVKTNPTFLIIVLCLVIASCNLLKRQMNFSDPSKEIEVDKTEIEYPNNLFGKSDDDFTTYACGRSSGHESTWLTYKKLGLALYTVSYTPDRDGFKNGVIRDIGIFDTTNLSIRKSQQHIAYYGQSYFPVTKSNLELAFGKPDIIRYVDTVQYISYSDKQMIFAFSKSNSKFIKLYIKNKK
jgi:hypothetical protein